MADDAGKSDKPAGGALVDIKITATDLAGLGRAGERAVDAIAAGVGPTVRHWLNTVFQRVEQGATKRWLETARSAGLTPTELEYRSVEGRTDLRIKAEHLRQQESREAISAYALRELPILRDQGKIANDPAPVESEWLNRFWRLAQDISRDDLRSVWGRLLARQTTTADQVTARTLDALSLLDGYDISHLERWASLQFIDAVGQPGVIYYVALDRSEEQLRLNPLCQQLQAHVGMDVLAHFGTIGLTGSTPFEPVIPFYPTRTEIRIGADRFWMRYTREPRASAKLYGISFSRTGREIVSLIHPGRDDAYLALLREMLALCAIELAPPGQPPG